MLKYLRGVLWRSFSTDSALPAKNQNTEHRKDYYLSCLRWSPLSLTSRKTFTASQLA